MHPKEADAMANSVDPDQTASSEAVCSWSALFAETYLSQYIEFLRYVLLWHYGAILCNQGDVKHLKLLRKKTTKTLDFLQSITCSFKLTFCNSTEIQAGADWIDFMLVVLGDVVWLLSAGKIG